MSVLSCFPGGGGDTHLNVITRESAVDLPASEREGTIGLITAMQVNNVHVSAGTIISPESGDVWIWLGSSSLAPVVFDDVITLHPRAAYQYNGSQWILVPAYVYIDSAWVEIALTLYKMGAFILVSGIELTVTRYAGVLTLKPTSIELHASCNPVGDFALIEAFFSQPVDLTGVNSVKIVETYSGQPINNVKAEVSTIKGFDGLVASATTNTAGTQTLTVDTFALSGLHYIGLRAQSQATEAGYGGNAYIYITDVYLVK